MSQWDLLTESADANNSWFSPPMQQAWKQAKTSTLYSKPLLCANTVKNTGYKTDTKLCKITRIHMMSSMGRSANPGQIPTI